jgi:predicted amidophosphoribosyltransferase
MAIAQYKYCPRCHDKIEHINGQCSNCIRLKNIFGEATKNVAKERFLALPIEKQIEWLYDRLS